LTRRRLDDFMIGNFIVSYLKIVIPDHSQPPVPYLPKCQARPVEVMKSLGAGVSAVPRFSEDIRERQAITTRIRV